MKKKYLLKAFDLRILLLFFLCSTVVIGKMSAQCGPPSSVVHTTSPSTCASNGVITVGTATGGSGDYLEYAVYNAANTTEVKPWQTATVFNDMSSGTYTLRVRYVCSLGYSTVFTKTVSVGGSYVVPSITNIAVIRRSQCNNGRIAVTTTGGTAPLTFALVPSLSEPEPMATSAYIRVPQSLSVFDSLPAGTHYVRVYDACGSYATNSVVINSFTPVNPIPNAGLNFQFRPCDSIVGSLTVNSPGDYVPGTADTLRKLWIVYPSGITDTIKYNYSGALFTLFNVPMDRWGPIVSTERFPDNIGGTWPKTIQAGYTDACGVVHTQNFTIAKPNYTVQWVRDVATSTCDTGAYRFRIEETANNWSYVGFPEVVMNAGMSFSIDGGETWEAVTTTGEFSQYIRLETASAFEACFAWCGDTTCFTGTIPLPPALTARVGENPVNACEGNTGFWFYAWTGIAPVTVDMVSGPEGQTWTPGTISVMPSGATAQTLPQGRNVLPGNYIFSFTDACGMVKYDTVTAQHPVTSFNIDYSFPCGSSNMVIDITDYSHTSVTRGTTGTSTATTSTTPFNGLLRAKIYHAADSTPAHTSNYSNTGAAITIPAAIILGLANGEYFVRVWRNNAPDSLCAFVDKPWTKNSNLISLSRSVTVNGCPGSPSTGSVIGIAEGGFGAYTFALYEGTFATENLVAGPQSSNIFNGLNNDDTYVLSVSDECGRGTQVTLSFSNTQLPVYNNTGGLMPCPGETLELSVNDMPGVSYQWYKNNEPLLNDTLHMLTVADIESSDSGAYNVELTVGSCAIFLASFTLSPDDCGTPLSVDWLHFSAIADANNVRLDWAVGNEENNKGFEVQRSENGTAWHNIGFINSQTETGNSTKRLDYQFIDKNPMIGQNYYRIKQLNIDGSYTISETRYVIFGQQFNTHIYPNPTKDFVVIEGLNGAENINIFDASGKKVKSMKNHNNLKLNVSLYDFIPGVYYIQILKENGVSDTYKIIKTNE